MVCVVALTNAQAVLKAGQLGQAPNVVLFWYSLAMNLQAARGFKVNSAFQGWGLQLCTTNPYESDYTHPRNFIFLFSKEDVILQARSSSKILFLLYSCMRWCGLVLAVGNQLSYFRFPLSSSAANSVLKVRDKGQAIQLPDETTPSVLLYQ